MPKKELQKEKRLFTFSVRLFIVFLISVLFLAYIIVAPNVVEVYCGAQAHRIVGDMPDMPTSVQPITSEEVAQIHGALSEGSQITLFFREQLKCERNIAKFLYPFLK